MALNGFLADHGWVPPTLERLIPALTGRQVLTFVLYAIILDFSDYWRHRLSHRFGWWWALHSLHHAQRQMTFWSDDRNHLLDDVIAFLWFTAVALLIGIPPLQFPLLVLVLRFLESLSHANVRLSFGWLGERLLISPRFHRAHHGVLAAGQRSCNYGAILPWWDMLFGTADFCTRLCQHRRSVRRGGAGHRRLRLPAMGGAAAVRHRAGGTLAASVSGSRGPASGQISMVTMSRMSRPPTMPARRSMPGHLSGGVQPWTSVITYTMAAWVPT